jgi:medium-chain acyl-[acyl-carrier-protein] hydrolase
MNSKLQTINKPSNSWIKSFSKGNVDPEIKLICFPFAGGGANVYRFWPSLIVKHVDVCAISLPGRESRILEKNVSNSDEVCNAIVAELIANYWHKPLVFFGHSMGSMLAYEVAIKLQEDYGWIPKLLIASGRQAPHKKIGGNFHQQPDDIFINELKRLNGTPSAIFEDAEMRKIVLSILRADYTLLETYRMKANTLLRAPIVTCCGMDDPEVEVYDMAFWSELTAIGCTHHTFDGDHFYLNANVQALTQLINSLIDSLIAPPINSITKN